MTPSLEAFSIANFTITMSRTGCYGICPAYTVRLSSKGVDFDGAAFTKYPGPHHTPIGPVRFAALLSSFEKAHFFRLKEAYRSEITDMPTTTLPMTAGK